MRKGEDLWRVELFSLLGAQQCRGNDVCHLLCRTFAIGKFLHKDPFVANDRIRYKALKRIREDFGRIAPNDTTIAHVSFTVVERQDLVRVLGDRYGTACMQPKNTARSVAKFWLNLVNTDCDRYRAVIIAFFIETRGQVHKQAKGLNVIKEFERKLISG